MQKVYEESIHADWQGKAVF